jgi:hypothetical protein
MLTTITVGTCVSIQGILVKKLSNGRVVVRVGKQTYSGRPVTA